MKTKLYFTDATADSGYRYIVVPSGVAVALARGDVPPFMDIEDLETKSRYIINTGNIIKVEFGS